LTETRASQTSRTQQLVRATQTMAIVFTAVLLVLPRSSRPVHILSGVLVSLTACVATTAGFHSYREASGLYRRLFQWIVVTGVLGTIAAIRLVIYAVSPGGRPPYPDMADFFLCGTQIAIDIGFLTAVAGARKSVGIEMILDAVLILAAVTVFLMMPFGAPRLPIPDVIHGSGPFTLVWFVAALANIPILALMIAWCGDYFSRRAMFGLILGSVSLALLNAWYAGSGAAGTPMDYVLSNILGLLIILGIISGMGSSAESAGTFERRLAARTAELSGVIRHLEHTVATERSDRAKMSEQERLASIGALVGGVAHEINNPLCSISAYAQLMLREDGLTPDQREALGVIEGETRRATSVVRDLQAFARRSRSHQEYIDLHEIIQRTIRLRHYSLTSGNVEIVTDLAPNLPILVGDPQQLQQVVLNLLTNAIQAVVPAGRGTIRVATRYENENAIFEMTDSGCGIPPGLRERIFEPFFTTRKEGEGSGLGLSVSYGIVAAHGGTIELTCANPGQTQFVIRLPVAPQSFEGSSGPPELRAQRG
jgi:signal transduction histidine kinase